VREDKVIDLNTAIEKMTLLPGKTLRSHCPWMRFKGRIQVGADADITIFNPNTVIDKASFEKGLEFSAGIEYVMVNGTFYIKKWQRQLEVFFPDKLFMESFKTEVIEKVYSLGHWIVRE
jgi:dihydroorotase-like cyclic amidohydrolase